MIDLEKKRRFESRKESHVDAGEETPRVTHTRLCRRDFYEARWP